MAHHLLSLNIPDILNTCILRVEDESVYNTLLPVTCFTLEVTPPGFTSPSTLTNLTPNYIVNLTACDLGIQTSNCDNYNNILVDGIYIIRQSMSPNDIVFVEYNHLRITNALNKYQQVLCGIQRVIDCDPIETTKVKIREAQFIRTLLDAAKAKVEFCHEPKAGMATYNYALSRLEDLSCTCVNR